MIDRRAILKNAAAGGIALSLLSPRQVLATEDDPYLRFVHPELRGIVRQMQPYLKSMPKYSVETLPAIRLGATKVAPPPRPDVPFERKLIPAGLDQPEVAIYIVNGKHDESRPAILHTHGGGFVAGSAEASVRELQDLCAELNCVAVSVEYRLAPETTFAGSLEDNYAGLKWLHSNAPSIGADPARIAVMGESAGGGHAALVAIAARDRGEVPVAFQCLVYPMLDDRTGSTRTPPEHVGHIIWTPESNRFGWECFLGRRPSGPRAPKGGVPARTDNLAGLPPAWIGVGSIDLFHDEDVEYAKRLNDAGVSTELIVVPGAFHGFDGMAAFDPKIRIVGWFNQAKKSALRSALGLPPV